MDKPELRREERIRVNFRGMLRLGEIAAPCLVQNMCSRGFLIKSEKELPVGKSLQLSCELYPETWVECTVQVRHVNAWCLGARVVEMSEEGQMLCRRFLQQQRTANPNR